MPKGMIGLCAVCFFSMLGLGMAQGQQPDGPPLPLRKLEEKARNSKRDARLTRAFVDEVFDSSVLKGAAQSVRDRVTRAENEYRKHNHPAIREADFVDAANRFVEDYRLPGYMRTNTAQVRRFRKLMTNMTPSAISSTERDEMTPAEAVLTAIQLGSQKLFNANYSVSADEWVRSVDHGNSEQAHLNRYLKPKTERPRLVGIPMSSDAVKVLNALDDDDQSEFSDLTFGLHLFLDSISVKR